jgi:hypothetical protein
MNTHQTIPTPPTPENHWQLTADGSWSWHDADIDELCHNRAGAYTEAMTQYVTPLLTHYRHGETLPAKTDWRLLDNGFGLGYNTWATCQSLITDWHARGDGLTPLDIHVWAIEIDPRMIARSMAILQQPYFHDLFSTLARSAHKIYYQYVYSI